MSGWVGIGRVRMKVLCSVVPSGKTYSSVSSSELWLLAGVVMARSMRMDDRDRNAVCGREQWARGACVCVLSRGWR